ncbi:TetR/AcrR family transcriptional regulator [Fictibacillus barbaricus]|uniref:AcrR family transcriptional regulator n=1 Tax=Fictibacillus barbaricus TaxID=182136 RepID=A0ABU1TW81_9BACL|nr:helix-turn-helix domain-containing protein [Fictibacillus barbaricus]MDR7071457.1 AcrR family transcriptional regulator [Fictibacillus barbaricus]
MEKVKKDKRVEIIEKAIEMFAEKGYHATSVQEIAKALSISKGGFYTYFPSKDDLIIEIFHYYSEKMRSGMKQVSEDHPPKKRMEMQLKVQIENYIAHKPFMQMHFREQNASIIKGIQVFIRKNFFELSKWYESHLMQIYGPKIEPYLSDVITICEGIKQSFIRAFMFIEDPVDIESFSLYLMERYDNVIQGLIHTDMNPVLDKKKMDEKLRPWSEKESKEEVAKDILNLIKEQIEQEPLEENQREDFIQVIEFILQEIKKDQPQKMVIQGMLANLRGVNNIEKERERFAELMNVQLL